MAQGEEGEDEEDSGSEEEEEEEDDDDEEGEGEDINNNKNQQLQANNSYRCECGKTVMNDNQARNSHNRGGIHSRYLAAKKREETVFAKTKPLNQETLDVLDNSELSSQILKYFDSVKLGDIESQRREFVRVNVENLVKRKWPGNIPLYFVILIIILLSL